MLKRAIFFFGAAFLAVAVACQSAGSDVKVTGTGRTNQPVVGAYPTPTPEWWTPSPTAPPTPEPPRVLPSPTPSLG